MSDENQTTTSETTDTIECELTSVADAICGATVHIAQGRDDLHGWVNRGFHEAEMGEVSIRDLTITPFVEDGITRFLVVLTHTCGESA
jgi:hypothetical protein